MRYVSYTRTTTCFAFEEIVESAIALQNEHISEYCKKHRITIEQKYVDRKKDPGCRVAFDQLMEDGMRRRFGCVVVDSIFRAGSSFWVTKEVLLQTFYYAGIHFIVVEDDFNSVRESRESVERYFAKRTGDARARELGYRNRNTHVYPEKKGTAYVAKNPGPKHVKSVIQFEIYDYATKVHMTKSKIYGGVFAVPTKGGSINKKNSMPIREAEDLVLQALKREQELACKVEEMLAAGEGRELLQEQIDDIGEEMKVRFAGVYSGAEDLLKTEEYFKAATEKVAKLEKAYSVNNLWIRHFLSWEEKEELTLADVKKYIKKAWMHDFSYVTITPMKEDWKELLPEEWMEVKMDGEKES